MPLFVIIGHDVAQSSKLRQETRTEHVARLQQLEAEDRLVIAGPTPIAYQADGSAETQMTGSVIIADFADIEAVQAWVDEEPYLKAGVYSHVEVKPFLHTLPKPKS